MRVIFRAIDLAGSFFDSQRDHRLRNENLKKDFIREGVAMCYLNKIIQPQILLITTKCVQSKATHLQQITLQENCGLCLRFTTNRE